jgi:hypothetical protein
MGDFLMQPPVIIMLAFVLICIVLLVGIVALLRSSRANQQASKKAAIQAELQPPVSRPKPVSNANTFEMFDAATSHDDPLADLYADDDDDSVDLASLLSGIGEEKVHTIANGQVSVRLESGNTAQARELLSVLRDENDGRLMILAGETAYRTLLNDPEVKKQFTAIMKELSAVILKPDDAAPAAHSPVVQSAISTATPQKTETPSVTEAPAPQQPTPKPAASVSNENTATSTRTMKEVAEPLPGDLPSFKMPDNPDNYKVGRFGSVSVKRIDKAPELNIADAIEAYLQYKIEQNPQYQRRGIHIKPALGGGVKIEADGKSYEFVDEVADADVRSFIQTAINEWQDRQ